MVVYATRDILLSGDLKCKCEFLVLRLILTAEDV